MTLEPNLEPTGNRLRNQPGIDFGIGIVIVLESTLEPTLEPESESLWNRLWNRFWNRLWNRNRNRFGTVLESESFGTGIGTGTEIGLASGIGIDPSPGIGIVPPLLRTFLPLVKWKILLKVYYLASHWIACKLFWLHVYISRYYSHSKMRHDFWNIRYNRSNKNHVFVIL